MPVLLCDLDDTLFDHDRATRDALADLRSHFSVLTQWSIEELDARHRVLLETLHLEVLAGQRTIDEARRERFARLLGQADAPSRTSVPGGGAELADALANSYRESYAGQWHAVPGAVELLQRVRADGHRIVIVTNNGVAEQELKLERCGLGVLIDAMVTSEEAGVSKPTPLIFEQALARANATSAEAVMLGDAWVADIEGARAAGVAPVWFNRKGHPRPDPTVIELTTLEPVSASMAALQQAGGPAWNQAAG